MINDSKGYIRLSFGPKWKYVACVRSFVQSFLAISISDSKKADKISMAVSELVENAVKYNAKEKTWIYLEVLSEEKAQILIEVENYALPENIQTLKNEVKKIYQKPPIEAYLEKMQEAVLKGNNTSQLGLARIRCEANCDIDVEMKPDNIVKVKAMFMD